MKKSSTIFIGVIFLIAICVSACSLSLSNSLPNTEDKEEKDVIGFEIPEIARSISENIFNMGCVSNEKDAEAIGRIILTSIYGEDFDCGLPLLVGFDDEGQVWRIESQLPEGWVGGANHIVIKKSNAEVVAIWGTK